MQNDEKQAKEPTVSNPVEAVVILRQENVMKGLIYFNGLLTDVYYSFVGDDTIEFVVPNGDLYYTHYKSLVI